MSILHRISGVFMFLGLIALLWWLVYISYAPVDHQSWLWSIISSLAGKIVIMLWTYSLFFHFCTGIRHLFWDWGYGFELKSMRIGGWIAFFASIILYATAWSLVLLF